LCVCQRNELSNVLSLLVQLGGAPSLRVRPPAQLGGVGPVGAWPTTPLQSASRAAIWGATVAGWQGDVSATAATTGTIVERSAMICKGQRFAQCEFVKTSLGREYANDKTKSWLERLHHLGGAGRPPRQLPEPPTPNYHDSTFSSCARMFASSLLPKRQGLVSQMPAREMPNDFVAASGAQVFDLGYFLKGALAGGICCSITHGALTPVDVVKTRIQLDSVKYNQGMIGGFKQIAAEEGTGALLTGLGPTVLGYFVQGACPRLALPPACSRLSIL
jgi:hypothetical protein